jgi:hypothetical protein
MKNLSFSDNGRLDEFFDIRGRKGKRLYHYSPWSFVKEEQSLK